MTGFRKALLLALASSALAALPAAAQQTGAIVGRVTERASGNAVPDANVVIVGTTRGARTNDQGRYRIAGLAAGIYTVRVVRLGYLAMSQSVTVGAGDSNADFELTSAAVTIDQVVVTATGESQRKRETGAAVATVQPTTEKLATSPTVADALAAEAPGVYVSSPGGTVGSANRIRIRGASSISLSNEPLIIIDGIRSSNESNGTGNIGVGGQGSSRLNDLNPEDIESFEVIKGPAAAALYGTAGANGVIQIRTKHGRAGAAKWTVYGEDGTQNDVTNYPANFAQVGTRTNNTRTTGCTLDAQTRGLCTPKPDSLVSWNPLEQASPFSTGYLRSYGLSVTGGADVANYFISTDLEDDRGVYVPNKFRRGSFRANVGAQLTPKLNTQVSTAFLTSRLRFPQNDNDILGIISGGLLGSAFDNPVSRGYLAGQTPQEIWAIDTREQVERFIGGTNTTWQALPWLSMTGVGGVDFFNRRNLETVPPNTVNFGSLPQGQRTSNDAQDWNYTANGSATATKDITASVRSTTTLGAQYAEELVQGTRAFGAQLLAGTGSLQGTSARFAVGETNTDNRTVGGLVSQQFAWRDLLFLTGSLRTDKNSAFGKNFGWTKYPAASLSYVISEEPFFPRSDMLNSLRLRAAYGKSGRQPNFRDAITYFNAQTVTISSSNTNLVDIPAITVGGTGNSDLRPEVSREYELGFEADLLSSRLGIDATYYNKRTNDLLVARPIPPSFGLTATQFANLGSSANDGFELQVNGHIVDMQVVKFDLTGNFSTNANKLISLGNLPTGQPIPPIVFGAQQHRPGYPLGGYWEKPISYKDANGDGIIARSEVTVGDTLVYMGNPLPKQEWSLTPRLGLFNWFEVSALFDHKGGFKLFDNTARFRCAFGNCRAAYDKTTSLADQAANIGIALGTDYGYVEDASYTKLRELAFTFTAPSDWARRARVQGAKLTIAGRNLHTWTGYKGLDPEVNSTPLTNFSSSDFLTQPPLRIWTARVTVQF